MDADDLVNTEPLQPVADLSVGLKLKKTTVHIDDSWPRESSDSSPGSLFTPVRSPTRFVPGVKPPSWNQVLEHSSWNPVLSQSGELFIDELDREPWAFLP
eukprot:CAMPEP_0114542322 /NCGR_PEP_ID=MMETSP0114-20121206/1777_1 /TAXON_ID=31324 /ORGANISM="Goniomonas sp, Strain m" /LENGTH=99 /DNA_ID=CAMNT_0001726619 /DNA_START=23 /DNA_END=322 /DNA_ORIENTATION=-